MEPCELLEWDSQLFGARIARVSGPLRTDLDLARVNAWCDANGIDCLQWLAEGDQPSLGRLAHAGGFRFVDVRLELRRAVGPAEPPSAVESGVRRASPADLPAITLIASRVHTDSRFVQDERFADRAPQLFGRWIARDFERAAGVVLVVGDGTAIAGYCSCFLTPGDTCGTISLVGVAPGCQRRGVGQLLTREAIRWFVGRGCKEISVVTQAANVRAQRLYQACGFKTVGCRIWFHRWQTTHVPIRYPEIASGPG